MDRREFLKGAVFGVGTALVGASRAPAVSIDDKQVAALVLRITCTTEILKKPSGKTMKLWVPVPIDDREQEISGMTVNSRIAHTTTEDAEWHNKMFFFTAEDPKAGDKIVLKYRLKRKAVGTMSDVQESPQRHLVPSEWEKWDDAIAHFVDELVAKQTDPIKIGRVVYDAIIDRTTYIHEACGRGVSAFTFEDKAGRCDEFHALFRSMMMYKGIPVKWEQGLLLPYPSVLKKRGEFDADCVNAHSWVKFHIGGGKWMPVDLSEAKRRPDLRDYYFGRITPNRIKLSSGRGLNLNPKQDGIINTFPYAYAEADGIPLIYSNQYRNTLKYELAEMESR